MSALGSSACCLMFPHWGARIKVFVQMRSIDTASHSGLDDVCEPLRAQTKP